MTIEAMKQALHDTELIRDIESGGVKYELVKTDTKQCDGKTLYRIKALIAIGLSVKVGDLGGYIESEKNLAQIGTAWVYGDAQVYDDARVFGDAWVSGNAQVCGDAWVSGNARVHGKAQVYGTAWVSGNAQVFGDAMVFGDARVHGNAQVCGDAVV